MPIVPKHEYVANSPPRSIHAARRFAGWGYCCPGSRFFARGWAWS